LAQKDVAVDFMLRTQ